MTKERIRLGKFGEKLARNKLKELGYKILDTNFRCPLGEIDLIAKDGDVLVFAEIKTRNNVSPGIVKEAVNPRKQAQISRVALSYIKLKNLMRAKARFDVVVIGVVDEKPEIEVIKNAFDLAC